MKKNLSITFKIVFGHLLIFGVLCSSYFMMIDKFTRWHISRKVNTSVHEWISDITSANNINACIELAKIKAKSFGYKIQVLNFERRKLFDSDWDQIHKEYAPPSPEMMTSQMKQEVPFRYQDQNYTLVIEFDYKKLPLNIRDIRFIYIFVGACFSLLFIILSLTMVTFLSKPIQKLFRAVNDYHKGKIQTLPEIVVQGRGEAAVFAHTLQRISSENKNLKLTKRSESQRNSAIFDVLSEGVVTIDATQTITHVNNKAAKMLGVPKARLIGFPIGEVTSKHKADELAKCCELSTIAFQNQTQVTGAVSSKLDDNMHLGIIASPIADAEGIVLILQDNSIEHKILTMGQEFISNASHELRTPITIIKGFAEMLHDLPEISESMLTEITEKIVRNCHRMSALVQNLLVLADLDNLSQTALKKCDVGLILENCRHQLLTIHPDVEVNIEKTKEPVYIHVDPSLIELAILNLLENAVKYSPDPASITMTVNIQGDDIMLAVSDQGIGIPEQDIQRIFDRFYTVSKSHTRKMGGAGLGLAIVRNIVEKHEGCLEVQSAIGEGATFTITLPRYVAQMTVNLSD